MMDTDKTDIKAFNSAFRKIMASSLMFPVLMPLMSDRLAKEVADHAIELEAIERKKALKRQRTEKRRRKLTDGVMNKLYGGE